MRYIICYDIADDNRRSRVANELKNYGHRTQESVFWADLSDALRDRMWRAIGKLVDAKADKLHVFAMCEGCQRKALQLGEEPAMEDPEFYIL